MGDINIHPRIKRANTEVSYINNAMNIELVDRNHVYLAFIRHHNCEHPLANCRTDCSRFIAIDLTETFRRGVLPETPGFLEVVKQRVRSHFDMYHAAEKHLLLTTCSIDVRYAPQNPSMRGVDLIKHPEAIATEVSLIRNRGYRDYLYIVFTSKAAPDLGFT